MAAHGAALLDGADCAVPVPLHRRRHRDRGFNQAAELARALDLPVVDALVRVRATASQTGLPAAQRHRNVRGAFQPAGAGLLGRRRAAVAGRTVVLVDDVCTTGATLEACAAALRAAGAREVRALTAARVVLPRP
jgi:ComF family protein